MNNTQGKEIFLIWGGESWIASLLYDLLHTTQGHDGDAVVHKTVIRMENREAVLDELDRVKPTHVLNCAGVTGRPNVDWCEDHRDDTLRSNVIGTLNLTDCCFVRGIHCTVFATGCLYTYDAAHPLGSGIGFTEDDPANFSDSFYSFTKAHTETLLKPYANTLILRLRMPVSDDLHPRSFLTKITRYDRVVDIPNSHTMLHDLLPCAILLARHQETGVFNFTNPGAISHNEVLALYKRYIAPDFLWENFSLEEQAKVIKAGRSNCELNVNKLVRKMDEFGVGRVPEIHEAYELCFARMAAEMYQKSTSFGTFSHTRSNGDDGM
ncbi:hypothetical protein AJ80_05659 [Polytolypa hystricis UAMH7299]|uniref:NAD-dependent epimerase/dehydratase domain-containing protein n=1 Tax=Polytolypa hystricis (strain UAMH7299) TaxID=1447883 RepID=A0A2B7Y380_POLH7|nr:hypothetical protein AJ80_05659 [Polytolypa hystricis UAMH7299]